MSREGRLSPKVKMMESLDDFAIAFENVIDACARLQLYYEATADMERLRAVSCELEAIEQDFNETEQLVKGYLNGSQRNISDISGSEPTGQSPRTEPSRTDRRTEKFQGRKSIESHRILNGCTSNAKRNSIRTLWNIISGQESEVNRHWVLLVNKVNR